MKKSFIILLMVFCTGIVKSQNLLNGSEEQIKKYMSEKEVHFSGKGYTKDGVAFLTYTYPISGSQPDGLVDSYYYLDESNNCNMSMMLFTHMKNLEPIVNNFKSNTELTRVTGKFGWINYSQKYEIEIKTNDDDSFILVYRNRK